MDPLPLTSLRELLASYLRAKLLAEPSTARYTLSVKNLEGYLALSSTGPIRVEQISSDVLLEYRDHLLKRMRAVSVNTERRHLSALFNFAVKRGWVRSNPLHDVPPVRAPRCLPKAIDRREMHAYLDFLATATKPRATGQAVEALPPQWFWLAVVKTFYFTGMRKRQLVELRWQDIRFASSTILLRAASSKTRKEWLIPLPEAIRGDLEKLRLRTVEIRGSDLSGCQVFCLPLFSTWRENFTTKEMRGDNVDAFFQRLRRSMPVHVGRISAHRIRHTTATVLANSVPNLKLVQEQLGHASITTTYGYVHADLAAMRSALGAL